MVGFLVDEEEMSICFESRGTKAGTKAMFQAVRNPLRSKFKADVLRTTAGTDTRGKNELTKKRQRPHRGEGLLSTLLWPACSDMCVLFPHPIRRPLAGEETWLLTSNPKEP